MTSPNQKIKRVIVLDDDPFFIDYFKGMIEKQVNELVLYQCESDFFDTENTLSLAATDLLILDYRLQSRTIVSLKLLELIRQDFNYKGAILVASTLNHFAFDQEYLNSYATACVDKANISWPKLILASGLGS